MNPKQEFNACKKNYKDSMLPFSLWRNCNWTISSVIIIQCCRERCKVQKHATSSWNCIVCQLGFWNFPVTLTQQLGYLLLLLLTLFKSGLLFREEMFFTETGKWDCRKRLICPVCKLLLRKVIGAKNFISATVERQEDINHSVAFCVEENCCLTMYICN